MNIIFSAGDCNGIGLEILCKALAEISQNEDLSAKMSFAIAVNPDIFKSYLSAFNFPVNIGKDYFSVNNLKCSIVKCKSKAEINFANVSADAGKHSAESINTALEKTISGEFSAMVTLPISKKALHLAGTQFAGHTELIADRCGVTRPMMILFHENIRVALATIHLPLQQVAKKIKFSLLKERISLFNQSLKNDFGIKKPKIAVLGLNPHSGEAGEIGDEEIEIINPAIEGARKTIPDIEGPFPADGFWGFDLYKNYDGVLAMYHDQGLIPIKMLSKGQGVNFTAGLPIVRTSPDHGTAFEIAGTGVADHSSLMNAIFSAMMIVENRSKI
ncbi:MAG: 4-hydroxythreonine-4-phosphate dehydrogenase PdxA [Bacteroidota bacterium]